MASAAQIAANQANGAKSRGAKTAKGRRKSKMNALKHGLRAKQHEALTDSGYAYEERRRKWLAQHDAQTDYDEFMISGSVTLACKFERAQRMSVADVASEIDDADEKDADRAEELGGLLFFDPTGPTPLYGIDPVHSDSIGPSWNGKASDPGKPAKIVKKLEATLAGCEFLLREWKRLRELAETGFWLSPDRFKAIRMLGRQPVNAIDDRRVAMIFVASHGVLRIGKTPFDDLRSDMREVALDRLVLRVKARFKELFHDSTEPECRQTLIDLADQYIKRLKSKCARHLKKAEAGAERTADELGNDRSPKGASMLALEMRCLNTIKRLMGPYQKGRKAGGKVAGGCPDAGRTVRAEREEAVTEQTCGHGDGRVGGGVETCGRDTGEVGDPRRTHHGDGGELSGGRDSRRGFTVELDASDFRACGGFLPSRVTDAFSGGVMGGSDDAAGNVVELFVDARFGGVSAAAGEAASGESVTNEPNFDEDVIFSQTQEIVEITTNSGVDLGLDKGDVERIPACDDFGETDLFEDPSAGGRTCPPSGEEAVMGGHSTTAGAECGGSSMLADPSAECEAASPESGEGFGEAEEAELRELQANLAIETVKRQARAGPMAESIRDLLASSPEAMEILGAFLPGYRPVSVVSGQLSVAENLGVHRESLPRGP